MADNRLDAALSDATRTQVLTGIAAARSALPFLLNLPPSELRRNALLGDGSAPFARRALEVARLYPDALPGRLDVDAFERDLALYDRIEPVRLALVELLEMVTDTQRLAGAEAYAAARDAYAALKRSRSESAALDGLVGELAERFAQAARPSAAPAPAP